jgi:hypothetical protein
MKRLLVVLIVLLFAGAGFTGCSDDQSSDASELGIQEGQRPKGEKRPPPGPPQGGFQQGEDTDDAPPESPDE